MVVVTSGVVVGQVVTVEDHPQAERIWLAQVDWGTGAVQIVFGGRRAVVQPASLVAVAPPGATVSIGRTVTRMRRRNYRGMPSHGMLCSLDELGWAVGAPDEVVILGNVRVGESLDGLAVHRRALVVVSPRWVSSTH